MTHATCESFYRREFPDHFKSYTGFVIGKATAAHWRETTGREPETVGGKNAYRAAYPELWLRLQWPYIIERLESQCPNQQQK